MKEIEANQQYVHKTFEDGRKLLRCVRAGQLPAGELPRKDTLPNIEKHLIDLHNHWERLLAEIVLEKERIDEVKELYDGSPLKGTIWYLIHWKGNVSKHNTRKGIKYFLTIAVLTFDNIFDNKMNQVMAPLESHLYRLDKMLAWLLAEQKKVEKDRQLGGTYTQLNKQLCNVKELEKNLNANKQRLKNLNEEGYKNLYNAG